MVAIRAVCMCLCYCQDALIGAMGFFIRTKLNNVFRPIFISDEEEQNKQKLIDTIIFKGKLTLCQFFICFFFNKLKQLTLF